MSLIQLHYPLIYLFIRITLCELYYPIFYFVNIGRYNLLTLEYPPNKINFFLSFEYLYFTFKSDNGLTIT